MIEILWADVSGLDESGASFELSEYRREWLAGVKPPAARRAGIGAELLLQRALRRYRPELPLPPRILCGENGKPYPADCDLYFNLSHSGDFAACALSGAPVGLDIQSPRAYHKKLTERYFAPEERLYIEKSKDKDAAFTEIWCRKESFIKATGEGLRRELRSFSATPETEALIHGETEFYLFSYALPDLFLSVCSPLPFPSIHIEKTELP